MKKVLIQLFTGTFIALLTPLVVSAQTTFFSDSFTNGSTLNSATPANPTATNTAYEMVASKAWNPNPPTITANDLKFGITATTSGYIQTEALFATNVVALVQAGDYIRLTVVFTNTTGLLTAAGQLGFGLYNSGQVKPVPGGINNLLPANFTGYAQNWLGYVADINYTGAASRVNSRPAQTLASVQNQDLITFGTSSSYANPVTAGTAAGNAALTAGSTYTEVLTITLNDVNSLAITNVLYSGPNTSGLVITNFGGVATNTSFTTAGFDALAIGYCGRATGAGNPLIDISSIKVDGAVTAITGPPSIDQQPLPVVVANGGSCAFNVAATGFTVTYQWKRHGTNLLNGGNISGATSSQLVVSPAGPADVLSGANGYYVVVTGAGPFSTNSVTNSLTLGTANNLFWTDSASTIWDLANSVNWQDGGATPQVFNYGDNVTFNDLGFGGAVNLNGPYLAAASVTVNSTYAYRFASTSTGGFAGPGSLTYSGPGQLTIENANTYTGGTTIATGAGTLLLKNYAGLGTGPVNANNPGGKLELFTSGGNTTGVGGDVNVNNDFTIQTDAAGTYAAVLLGSINGVTGSTLTFNPNDLTTTNRFRIYGTNGVCNANLVLNGPATSQALYNGTVLAPYQASGSQSYNGVISGVGGIVQRGTATTYLNNNQNTYSGGTFPTAGGIALGADSIPTTGTVISGPIGTGSLLLAPENGSATATGTVLASGGARQIANPLVYPSGTNNLTLVIGGTNDLTFTAPFALNGLDGVTSATYSSRFIQVTDTGAATLAGNITDTSGFNYALTKSGVGTLYLNGANTYPGVTTNTAGVLAGSGNLAGSVVVTTNASIGGGAATGIGTLTIGGSLTLSNANGFFRVNRSGYASDKVSVAGVLTNAGTGTITVTNLGTALQVNDTFYLFNKALSNSASMTVIGGSVAWSNNLALNGSIVVVSPPDTGVQVAAPTSVALGANITNTLTVTNAGPGTAYNMVVTDTLPANVKFVSATGGGTTNANVAKVVWTGFNLAANTSTNLTLIVNAPTVGNVTNIVVVASAATDLNPANNTVTNVTSVSTTIIPTVPPYIGSFNIVGSNLAINGTNGVTGGTYYLLSTTNVAKPLNQWTAVATNVVNTNGTSGAFLFTGTNVVTPSLGQQFYILSSTNH